MIVEDTTQYTTKTKPEVSKSEFDRFTLGLLEFRPCVDYAQINASVEYLRSEFGRRMTGDDKLDRDFILNGLKRMVREGKIVAVKYKPKSPQKDDDPRQQGTFYMLPHREIQIVGPCKVKLEIL